MTKQLEYLIIHCTATPIGRIVTKEDIVAWHTDPKPRGRGWSKAGYSDMIDIDGKLVNITPFDQDDDKEAWEVTNGVRGINGVAHHIVYVGGCDARMQPMDTRTPVQKGALGIYLKYAVLRWPNIKIAGHNYFDAGKACPSFDVAQWCRAIGLSENNIL